MLRKIRYWLGGILAAILAVFAPQLFSDDNTLNWQAPTVWDDGTPMPASEISFYNIYYSNDGVPFALLDTSVTTSYLDTNRTNGEHCYYVTAVRTNGLEGGQSNTACKVIDLRLPGAPTNLTVD